MKLTLQSIKALLMKNDKHVSEVINTAQKIHEELSPIFIRVTSLHIPDQSKIYIGKNNTTNRATYGDLLNIKKAHVNGTPVYLYDAGMSAVTPVLNFIDLGSALAISWVYGGITTSEMSSFKAEVKYMTIIKSEYT